LNRKYPNVQKAILTGFATEAYRAACLGNGAELFLEKPKSREEQQSVFSALNELLKWQPEEGFQGVLRRVGLQDVIQMECLSSNSSVLEVKAGRDQGKIFIREGAIVHAEIGDLKGEPAFQRLLALKGGEFWHRAFASPDEETIEGPWEFLLMEAARKRDEDAEASPEAVEEEVIESVTEFVAKAAASFAPLPQKSAEPPATPEPQAPEAQPPPAETAPEPVSEPAPALSSVIDEMLICSSAGEILHEWQCRNSDLWVNFFEFLSRKSQRLALGLPLGHFERLELEGREERLVARVAKDGGVLVRSHPRKSESE
jgi:hypothetical protein